MMNERLIEYDQTFVVYRKPLARPVVQKKATADNEDRKTPFALKSECGLTTAQEKAKGGHPNDE